MQNKNQNTCQSTVLWKQSVLFQLAKVLRGFLPSSGGPQTPLFKCVGITKNQAPIPAPKHPVPRRTHKPTLMFGKVVVANWRVYFPVHSLLSTKSYSERWRQMCKSLYPSLDSFKSLGKPVRLQQDSISCSVVVRGGGDEIALHIH